MNVSVGPFHPSLMCPSSSISPVYETGLVFQFIDPEPDDLPPPPLKREESVSNVVRRKSRLRGKEGSLSQLVDMPIDVLFEIFQHLEPLDLLHLTRANRALFNLLMHRSATAIWRSARKNILYAELYLDCPEDMSEPAYARLMFDIRCHFCCVSRVQNPFWAWRVRCCRKCYQEHFIEIDIRHDLKDKDYHPFEPFGAESGRRRYYLEAALEQFQKEKNIARERGNLEEFLQERRAKVARIQERALRESLQANVRYKFREALYRGARDERRAEIKARLCSLGWEQEFNLMPIYDNSFRKHPLVSKSQPLTERIWNNIKYDLILFMENVRARRVIHERQIMFRPIVKHFRSLYPSEIIPSDADVLRFPQVSAVMDSAVTNTVTNSDIVSVLNQILRLTTDWRQKADSFLLALFPVPTTNILDLYLAIAVFRCQCCRKPITYPRILVHKCLTTAGLDRKSRFAFPRDDRWADVFQSLGCHPWNYNGNMVTYDEKAATVARKFVSMCNMNPETTTALKMDKYNISFVCNCSVPASDQCSTQRFCMTWRYAVEHAVLSAGHNENSTWTMIDGNQHQLDKTFMKIFKEEGTRIRSREPYTGFWRCRRCGRFEPRSIEMQAHLEEAHDLEIGVVDEEHCIKHMDTPAPTFNSFMIPEDLYMQYLHDYVEMIKQYIDLPDSMEV